jgi:SAM-dependent methyltransferase
MSILAPATPASVAPEGLTLAPAEIYALFADGVVRHGPFAGLRYPLLQSIGSSLFPKLLGSYEAELHPWIDEICAGGYTEIVDIGCAEGYYAVGLARRLPHAQVYAYDIDDRARELCAASSRLNGVDGRVAGRAAFATDQLADIAVRGRGLIVCDCEGAELDLFAADTVSACAEWDLLIETHDFMDLTGSTRLMERFRTTHDVRTCLSVDDIQKAKHYHYPELAPLDLATRRAIVAEGRPAIMEWLFFTARAA